MTTPKTYGPEGKTLGQIAWDSFDYRYEWNALSESDQLCWQESAEAVASAVEPKWISVKKRLPEKDTLVLVSTISDEVVTDEWVDIYEYPLGNTSAGFISGQGWSDHDDGIITHWMPLPQPPAE